MSTPDSNPVSPAVALKRLLRCGTLLANLAFNLCQHDSLSQGSKDLLRSSQLEWDQAYRDYHQAKKHKR